MLPSLAPPSPAQEAALLHQGAGGVIDVQGENTISIESIEGTLHIRVGKSGELRFECRSLDNRRSEEPVALWAEERRFIIRPPEGSQPKRLLLEVAVPPELTVQLELEDSLLQATGLHGALRAKGRDVSFQGRGLVGSVDLEITGGKVKIAGAQDDVRLSGRDLEVELEQVDGFVNLSLVAAAVRLNDLADGLDAELEESTFAASNIAGHVELSASNSSVDLHSALQGGSLDLEETPLILAETHGTLEIQTDSTVEFNSHTGGLRVEGYRAAVRGSGVNGPLTLSSSDAEIVLEKLGGDTRIEGDRLTVRVQEVKGGLTLTATSSNVSLEGIEGTVEVENDFGDVLINEAKKDVKVTSRDGNVHLSALSGSLELKADGPEVVVGWIGMDREKGSIVENAGGTVKLEFHPKAACRLQAESKFGRIESALRDVRVSEDESEASGVLSRATRPMIQAVSYGDMYLGYRTPKKRQESSD